MKVRDTIPRSDGRRIEIGGATWDDSEISIRNRYPTSNGGFSPRSSSEIPLSDLESILAAVAERDLLDGAATARLIEALAASLSRRIAAGVSPSLQSLLDHVTEENRHEEIEIGAPVGNEAW